MSLLENYLQDLKEITSFDSGSANAAGVTRAAEFMKRRYEEAGFAAELIDFGPEAGKGVIARNKPEAGRYDVIFSSHLDTVFPDGEAQRRPFRIEGNRAMAPGVMDCKGGVIATLYALKGLPPEVLSRLSVCVLHNPDEETGSVHSNRRIMEEAKKARFGLVSEPARADGSMIRSRKGIAGYRVTFRGLATHAGNAPEKGHDANLALMRFTLEAVKLNDIPNGVSVSPTMMSGGRIQNAISDHAELYLDCRFKNEEQELKIEEGLRALASRSWGEGVSAELEFDHGRPAMPCTEKSRELIALLEESAREAGFGIAWQDAGGGSDASYIAKAGTPAVDGCGPAGGCAHNRDEYLEIGTVEERIAMIQNFLKKL